MRPASLGRKISAESMRMSGYVEKPMVFLRVFMVNIWLIRVFMANGMMVRVNS